MRENFFNVLLDLDKTYQLCFNLFSFEIFHLKFKKQFLNNIYIYIYIRLIPKSLIKWRNKTRIFHKSQLYLKSHLKAINKVENKRKVLNFPFSSSHFHLFSHTIIRETNLDLTSKSDSNPFSGPVL